MEMDMASASAITAPGSSISIALAGGRPPRCSLPTRSLQRVAPALHKDLLPKHTFTSHRHCLQHRFSQVPNLRFSIQASTPITFHADNTTITIPLSQAAVVGLSKAIESVLNTFREKEKAERPRRWDSMEFKHTEDGVFVEFFCNPNAHANPFQAKILITVSDEKIKIVTEGKLSAIKTDVDQYAKAVL